jgi:hypothetical protein
MSLHTVLPVSPLGFRAVHGLSINFSRNAKSRFSGDSCGASSPGFSDFPQQAVHNQWPWRAFAFASDAGFIAYASGARRWAHLAWILSLPYYAVALAQAPNAKALKREALFQVTANGVLPFVAAHVGVFWAKLSWPSAKHALGRFKNVSQRRVNTAKITWLAGVSSAILMGLTVSVNDPLIKGLFERLNRSDCKRL